MPRILHWIIMRFMKNVNEDTGKGSNQRKSKWDKSQETRYQLPFPNVVNESRMRGITLRLYLRGTQKIYGLWAEINHKLASFMPHKPQLRSTAPTQKLKG